MIAPQFKTWFYIYRNNSAEEEFKRILTNDYLVEVKDIERFDYDFDSPRTAEQPTENDIQKLPTNSKDVIQFDDLKNTEPKDEQGNIDGFETLKFAIDLPSQVDQANADFNQLNHDEKDKVSKFDKHVDEAQYVEVPEIQKEMKEEKKNTEKEHLKKKLQKENDGPEKVTLPLKKYMEDSMEIMEAQENRHFTSRVRNLIESFDKIKKLKVLFIFSLDEHSHCILKVMSLQLSVETQSLVAKAETLRRAAAAWSQRCFYSMVFTSEVTGLNLSWSSVLTKLRFSML